MAAEGTRLVFADGEWVVSDLPLRDVEALLAAGHLVPARRQGKRLVVNPAHVVYAEEWALPEEE